MMAEALAKGEKYWMFEEEPEHCAEAILSVLEDLWKMRTETKWPNEPDRKRQEVAMQKAFDKATERAKKA